MAKYSAGVNSVIEQQQVPEGINPQSKCWILWDLVGNFEYCYGYPMFIEVEGAV